MNHNSSVEWGAVKPLGPAPTHCPFCGQPIAVVREILRGWFELACEACERTAVISIDDHQALR